MEINNSYPDFIPMRLASNYYHKWDSDVKMKNQMNTYFKCLEGQCEIELKNNCNYQGEIKNGKYQGKGQFVWKNGVTYKGDFKNSQITGFGKIIWPNGSFYDGELLNGEQHGVGTFYSSTESFKYIGQWKQGKKQGKGKIQYKDQSMFEGNFKNDKKNGYGKIIYSSKNQYQGEWLNDKKDGKGTMNWYSGHERYIGQWKNGLQEGYGQYYWLENRTEYKIFKNVYKGYWKKGKREGFGVFFYSNGCRFEGYFFENLKEGPGISIDEQGVARTHIYKNNRLTQIRAKNILNKKENCVKQGKKGQQEIDSKLPLLSKKQSKNDGQASIDQAPKSNFSNSSHKISENEYKRYLDFEHPEINENFYNMLLRLNSRFRYLYKIIGTSNINVKDCYTGMVLENYWKILRECRLLNENLSLVGVDREFNKGTRSNFSLGLPDQKILQIVNVQKYSFDVVPYEDILWHDYFSKIEEQTSLQWPQFFFESKYQFQLGWKKSSATVDIHNSLNIILFRHFICLIIHTALLYDQSTQKPLKEKVQNLVNILEHSNEVNSKNERAQIQDSTTQITRSITVPQWVKSIHQEIVYELEKPKQNFIKKLDVSVPVRRMYSLLEYCNIFKDLNEKIIYLQRIQRYLNIRNSPLKKQYRNYVTEIDKSLKLNPAFGYLMNYQMNLKQINQFLFLCISRKILASSQEQFQNKYQQIVKNMLNFIKTEKSKILISAFYNQSEGNGEGVKAKKIVSWKDKKREELLIEAEKQKEKKKEQEKKKKQLQRERIQRQAMAKQDFDTEELVSQSEESEDYYG